MLLYLCIIVLFCFYINVCFAPVKRIQIRFSILLKRVTVAIMLSVQFSVHFSFRTVDEAHVHTK